MKKSLLAFIICVVLVMVLSVTIHWLVGLLPIFVVTVLLKPSMRNAFAQGFLCVFMAWAGTAFYLSSINHHIMSNQVGELFGGIQPIALVLLSGIIGGMAGGLMGVSATVLFGRRLKEVGL